MRKKTHIPVLLLMAALIVSHPSRACSQTTAVDESAAAFLALADSAKMMYFKQQCWVLRTEDKERAYEYGLRALHIAQALKNDEELASIYNYIGVVQRYAENYDAAIEYYSRALTIAELNNIPKEQGYALNNLGNIAQIRGDYHKALRYSKRALQITSALNDVASMAYCNYHIGETLVHLDQLDSALVYHQRACQLRRDHHLYPQIHGSLRAMAKIYYIRSEPEKSKALLEESLAYLIQRPNDFEKAGTLYEMSRYYLVIDSLGEGARLLKQVIDIGSERDFWSFKELAARDLSGLYARINDYENALKFHHLFFEFRDSIVQEETSVKIKNLSLLFRYDEEKQAMEAREKKREQRTRVMVSILLGSLIIISLFAFSLHRQNQIKMKANLELEAKNRLILSQKRDLERIKQDLEASNQTKDRFFSILAHDLRSPFNTILNFSQILADQAKKNNFSDVITFSNYVYEASRQSYNLVVNLLDWSRTQRGKVKFNPEWVEVESLVEETCQLVAQVYLDKKIHIRYQVQSATEILADRNMLSTVLRNLLSNASKFSHPGGEVRVVTKDVHDGVAFAVIDEGVGMKEDVKAHLFQVGNEFSTAGTQNEKGSGLGLALVRDFIDMHGGSIEVESEAGRGTTMRFVIPARDI